MNRLKTGLADITAVRPGPGRLRKDLALARNDLQRGFSDWRTWLLLGMNDVRQRYQRSRVGQFWITLSVVVNIATLGAVYSYLFRMSIREYLPSLAMGIIVWGLISAMVTDACTVFTSAESYLRQAPIAKSIFVHRMLVRNLITFAHNVVIVPVLYVAFGMGPGWPIFLVPIGLAIVTINGFWIGLLVGTLCARFRDLPQIVASFMQIAFFVTPVMWKRDQLPPTLSWVVDLNPFAALLAVIREPLLGAVPDRSAYVMSFGVTAIGLVVAIRFFARFRARIIYWL